MRDAAGGDDRAHRDAGVSHPHAARLLRRDAWPRPCGHCDRCRAPVRTVNALIEAQKVLSAVYRTGQHVRRAAHRLRAARRAHRGGAAPPPRPAAAVRHRRRPPARVLAQRDRGGCSRWARCAPRRASSRRLALVPDAARPILRGEQRCCSPRSRRRRRTRRRRAARRSRPHRRRGWALAGRRGTAFEALRNWRLRAAKAQAVPPYVIFHDSVLREIAAVRPATIEELGQIKGVGASKLARYGREVLTAVRCRLSPPATWTAHYPAPLSLARIPEAPCCSISRRSPSRSGTS